MHRTALSTAGFIVLFATTTTLSASPETVVTFDSGARGWSGPGGPGGATTIDIDDGTPAPSLRTVFNDFGVTFRTTTNDAFVRDYTTQALTVRFSVDTKVRFLNFFGQDVSRPWLIELRDFDLGMDGYPWSGVWYKFADISAAQHGEWTTFTVTIEDSTASDLPAGWEGTGAEDPMTFEPTLPAGVTFADVLAGVDEVVFTTLEPGFFFSFTDHDIALDNITVAVGPAAPGCNPSDIAEPFGVTDLADIQCYVTLFLDGDDLADFEPPFGVHDLADLQSFIVNFVNGCP
jgi:hypothetical protein